MFHRIMQQCRHVVRRCISTVSYTHLVDHNNGLLLCRNHDYLFDQGYFTFDDRGYVILSHELLKHMETCDAYGIAKNYHIPEEYMTKNRRLFLAYHRAYIFKDKLLGETRCL